MSYYQGLLEWDREPVYIGSILVKNKNVPLFEEYFGQLDYDWLLRLTKNRSVVVTEPVVKRYMTGINLSLDSEYRKKDFYMVLLHVDGNLKAMRRVYGTRARYYYYMLNGKMARFYFRQSVMTWKTMLYCVTSFSKTAMKFVNRKFRVFG